MELLPVIARPSMGQAFSPLLAVGLLIGSKPTLAHPQLIAELSNDGVDAVGILF